MDWSEEYKRKLTTVEEAVKAVKSGDRVAVAYLPEPRVLQRALAARRDELENVEIVTLTPSTDPGWFQPGWEKSFRHTFEVFIGNIARPVMDEKRADFVTSTFGRQFKPIDDKVPGVRAADVFMVVISPPDENGFCSFGTTLFTKKGYIRRSKIVIAEVDSSQIRTFGGDNFIHVSEIDRFVEYTPPEMTDKYIDQLLRDADPVRCARFREVISKFGMEQRAELVPLMLEAPTEELATWPELMGLGEPKEFEKRIAEYISTLVRDGDTIEIGTGRATTRLSRLGTFDDKVDLGWHTENIQGGVVKLVKAGIVTGKRKTINVGKCVGGSIIGCDEEDWAFINNNPMFELREIEYVNDIRVIAAHDNIVAINNILSIDLTGQINAETVLGPRMWNGPGGQPDFAVGANLSKGGRYVAVLPSTALGGSVSRIVPLFEEGTVVTVPRYLTHYVVTEYGIANLLGKTFRERADELIGITHPDFRAELRKEARKLFYP